jgi:hypothetical protein
MFKMAVFEFVVRISSLVFRFQPAKYASRTTLHGFQERRENKARSKARFGALGSGG